MYYKILKKIVGTLGFKLAEKNTVKNDRLISSNSYLKIDRILNYLFLSNKLKTIIQIGANDGMRFDVLNKYIKKYNPKVILVEPIKSNFLDLKKNYKNQKNLFFENSAISVDNKINKLFKVKNSKLGLYDEHIIGITSFEKNHLIKHGVKKNHIIEEIVNSISISELLKKYSIEDLDLLYIDTEGYDGEIILDFLNKSRLKPIIIFEYVHINHQVLKKTLNQLNNNKFYFFKIDENILCFPAEKKSTLNFF
tara:strand:- start:766 stop:1518 length:753 start_codon:yes stop_codon:yes gene_type:complete